jgi:hypothetical protein
LENGIVKIEYTYDRYFEQMVALGYTPMTERKFIEMQELQAWESTARAKKGSKPKPTNFEEYNKHET